MGTDDHTYRAIGAFFDFIGKNGGNPQQAVIYGASRAGLAALMWTINPLQLNYKVIAVFADIMPTAMGSLSQRSVLTYPAMSYLYSTATHNSDLYKYSLTNGAGHYDPGIFLGTSDPSAADSLSPLGMADGLRGKIVVVGRGTHDPFIPFRDFVAFDRHLTNIGIAHTSIITLGHGHISNWIVLQAFALYVRGLMAGKPVVPTPGRYIYINLLPPDGKIVALSAFLQRGLAADPNTPALSSTALPFTAEVPLGAGVGLPVDVALCGAAGASYSYSAQEANGNIWTKGDGKFGSGECVHSEITAPDQPGDYTWTFTYKNLPISSNNTPRRDTNGCGLPAVTHVTMDQPSPTDLAAGQFALGDGVDQFSAQQPNCK